MKTNPIGESQRRMTMTATCGNPSRRTALAGRGVLVWVATLVWMLAGLPQPAARAADMYWTDIYSPRSFTGAGSWEGVVPGAADNAHFTNNVGHWWQLTFDTADIMNANAFINGGAYNQYLELGYGYSWLLTNSFVVGQNAGQTGIAVQTAATGNLLVTNSAGTATMVVGQSGVGTYQMYGGTVTADRLFVTNGASSMFILSSGTLNTLHGATISSANSGNYLVVGPADGPGQTAIWNILGGTNVTSSPSFYTFIGDIGYSGASGGVGKVNASGPATVWSNNAELVVGRYRPNNSLVITNGARVFNNGDFVYLGFADGGGSLNSSNNTLTVTGSNSLLSSSNFIKIGLGGTDNKLTIADGGQVVVASGVSVLGENSSSSNNTALVTDAHSLWNSIAGIAVGGSGSGNQLAIQNGGEVRAAGSMIVGRDATSSNNLILVSGGGVLAANTLIANAVAGSANNSITNFGGIFQFSTATPTITPNAARGGSIVLTNGLISFQGIADANVKGNWSGSDLVNMTFLGANKFRLDNASNTTSGQDYTFETGLGATNYVGLEMINGATAWRGGSLTIGNGGTLLVSNTVASIAGVMTNSGTMTVMNGSVVYGGNVVNLGSYVSDPSTNTFNGNFTVGPTATVVAAAGDVYALGANFTLQSTNRAYDMHLAQVVFTDTGYGITTGTTNHTFDLAGSGAVDKGSNWLNVAQLATNFSIGTLSIASNNNLTVTGTRLGSLTNALYVGWLDLQVLEVQGITTNNMTALTNGIFAALDLPNINLYYDKNVFQNAYLGGLEYNLWGGQGLLIPIPEPSALTLTLAAAALSVFILRRKDRRE